MKLISCRKSIEIDLSDYEYQTEYFCNSMFFINNYIDVHVNEYQAGLQIIYLKDSI